ncbi:DUF4265 domain-containing protein [Nannocystis sp. ILAH1]|uniref:DUF4265 domain-containing protein n=1 Tax=Nannocystis sp. ILAH1 TaxID=2996789 RepID=UPI00226E7B79|nr:DUF4265 domain-containing protein [Nannocystis sp. ILAH1]MCY0989965.1 DUF4265 domain-containing protein [Nannocystis sp. ILAH1]
MKTHHETPRPLVKILFEPNDDYYTTTESLWAEDLGEERYRLRNSPWYYYGVSFGDIVRAEPLSGGGLAFAEVLERSGSSTFRIMLREGIDEPQFQRYWRPLESLGCTLERAKGGFYAIDAPPGADLSNVTARLTAGTDHGVWDWETGYMHEGPDTTEAKQSLRPSRARRS